MCGRCDESSLYSRINYVHSPDGTSAGVSGNPFETFLQGFSILRIALCQRPGAVGEDLDVMI